MSLLDDYKDGWLENLKRPTMMNCVSSVCFHFLIHPELLTIDDEDNETAIKIKFKRMIEKGSMKIILLLKGFIFSE